MKTFLIVWLELLAMACHSANSPGEPMQTNTLIRTVTDIFVGSDECDWPRVSRSFAPQVLLDYSSMTGQQAANQTPDQIIAGWRAVLPGFEKTHHQLGNFAVEQTGNSATIFCYGTATHYLSQPDGRSVWTVVGTYNFHLVRQGESWQVDQMRFNFKYQDGNTELPKLATQRVAVGNGR